MDISIALGHHAHVIIGQTAPLASDFIECLPEDREDAANQLLAKAPGVKIVDDIEKNIFPMPLDASDQYDILVGRIRKDPAFENGLAMFIAGDQLLKGAALNAVQIAELLAE